MEQANRHTFAVNEIFTSIQGEGIRTGVLCLFVRFQGCNLDCPWCDTKYARNICSGETKNYSDEELLKIITESKIEFVEFTGGEPALNKYLPDLCLKLVNLGFKVALETNGSILLDKYDKRVIKIMDLKTPDSGVDSSNNYDNIEYLTKNDEVKFVISSKNDYLWAKEIIESFRLIEKVNAVNISPVFSAVEPNELAEWIIADELNVRFNLQIQKYIWEPDRRGV